MAGLEHNVRVCVCVHALHTCCIYTSIHIHISPPRPIQMPGQTMSNGCPQILCGESVHADKCVVVCVWGWVCVLGWGGVGVCVCVGGCWGRGGGGWRRKDTLTNQSLHSSSRLAHRDLEFSRAAVSSPQPLTLKTKHRLFFKALQRRMRMFAVHKHKPRYYKRRKKSRNNVDKTKVRTSLSLLERRLESRKEKARHFSCCCLKVIEFLIDFSQFYFKFIKPGRIA